MKEFKLVFSGTTGAGKSTAISAISDTSTVQTDVANNDTVFDKETTTVGLDFGQLSLANGDRVRLFGTPGQTRFDFMWKILVREAFGLIILIDNSRPDPLADLRVYLDGFIEELQNTPCVIGVGRTESHPMPDLDAFSDCLATYDLALPVLKVDVRQAEQVAMLIDVVMAQAETEL